MNAELVVPLIASLAWLFFAVSALASYRLGWNQIVKMALVWVSIFGGLFMIVEWYTTIRDTTSGFI